MFNQCTVETIGYKTAMEIVIRDHYLHRKCHCSTAVGLMQNNDIVGVAIFGKPASYTLCNAICGLEETLNVGEFSRLWVSDCMPRNTESWFLTKAIKLCKYEILVSFADTEQGHIGYIYQATNWLYTGVSKRQRYFRLKTSDNDGGGVAYRRRARMSKAKIIADYGPDAVSEYWSSSKHRYVFFNTTNKKRKKELLVKLKYPVLAYPKG